MSDKITYIPKGTCSRKIDVSINNNIIESVEFTGGCPGSLIGINNLISGMDVREAVNKVDGIRCGSKSTSCPDQLARALFEYINAETN